MKKVKHPSIDLGNWPAAAKAGNCQVDHRSREEKLLLDEALACIPELVAGRYFTGSVLNLCEEGNPIVDAFISAASDGGFTFRKWLQVAGPMKIGRVRDRILAEMSKHAKTFAGWSWVADWATVGSPIYEQAIGQMRKGTREDWENAISDGHHKGGRLFQLQQDICPL